jgi:hypothetical protein
MRTIPIARTRSSQAFSASRRRRVDDQPAERVEPQERPEDFRDQLDSPVATYHMGELVGGGTADTIRRATCRVGWEQHLRTAGSPREEHCVTIAFAHRDGRANAVGGLDATGFRNPGTRPRLRRA